MALAGYLYIVYTALWIRIRAPSSYLKALIARLQSGKGTQSDTKLSNPNPGQQETVMTLSQQYIIARIAMHHRQSSIAESPVCCIQRLSRDQSSLVTDDRVGLCSKAARHLSCLISCKLHRT